MLDIGVGHALTVTVGPDNQQRMELHWPPRVTGVSYAAFENSMVTKKNLILTITSNFIKFGII
jgi:hypothetical protein